MKLSTVTPSGFSLLQIQGPDAIKFLQGQVTCDLNTLSPTLLRHGAHCTAKGRMIANFDVIKRDDQTLWLRLPSDNLAQLQQSLAKYIVFSKAKLTDLTDSHYSLGLIGEDLNDWLKNKKIDFDTQTITELDGTLFIKLDDQRIEAWSTIDASEFNELKTTPQLAEPSAWAIGAINSGKGWITQATSDAFLPQDLNLQTDTIDGINFKKGCYTGQEIVARMHYKGKLKRHLYHFRIETTQEIEAGAELVLGDKTQSAGTIVNAVTSGQHCNLLAVTTETAADSGELHLTGATTDKLTLVPLPYAITNEVQA